MKKLLVGVVFIAFFVTGMTVFAQDDQDKKNTEYYYKNISLERIYPHSKGYIVLYRSGINRLSTAYLPMEWFNSGEVKSEIVTLPRGQAWPYMSVYYSEGEFSHVRLYVHPQTSHRTWGVAPRDANFEGIETLELKF